MTEQSVMLTARIYECRKSLRFLCGDKYQASVERWKQQILCTRPDGVSVMSHTIKLAECADDDMVTMWLMAALVEITETKES